MSADNSELIWLDKPEARGPYLVAAFTGWPDAGEVASGALRYLVAKLGATKVGYLATDDFSDFTTSRPVTVIEEGAIRVLRYPSNDLFFWRDPEGNHDLFVLLGSEPQLRWRRYVNLLIDLMAQVGAGTSVSLGGLFDAVPHTAEPRVSGVASSTELRERLLGLGVRLTNYQGPSSIHTSLVTFCQERSIAAVSLWGHAPMYVRAVANPKVCHGLLDKLCRLLAIPLNLEDLARAGEYLTETLDRLLQQNEELRLYVRQLEEQHGGQSEPGADLLGDTEKIVRDVEEFLRREQNQGGQGD